MLITVERTALPVGATKDDRSWRWLLVLFQFQDKAVENVWVLLLGCVYEVVENVWSFL